MGEGQAVEARAHLGLGAGQSGDELLWHVNRSRLFVTADHDLDFVAGLDPGRVADLAVQPEVGVAAVDGEP